MFLHLAGLWMVVLLMALVFRRDDPSLRRRRPAERHAVARGRV